MGYRWRPKQNNRRSNPQRKRWEQGQHNNEHRREPAAAPKPKQQDWLLRAVGGNYKKHDMAEAAIRDVRDGRRPANVMIEYLKREGIDHHRIESAILEAQSERIHANTEPYIGPLVQKVRNGEMGEKEACEALKSMRICTPEAERRLHDAEGECLLELLFKKRVYPKSSPQTDELMLKAMREGNMDAWKRLQSPRKILESCVGLEHREDPKMRKERLEGIQRRRLRALNRVTDLKKANQIDDATYRRIHTWLMEDEFY